MLYGFYNRIIKYVVILYWAISYYIVLLTGWLYVYVYIYIFTVSLENVTA